MRLVTVRHQGEHSRELDGATRREHHPRRLWRPDDPRGAHEGLGEASQMVDGPTNLE